MHAKRTMSVTPVSHDIILLEACASLSALASFSARALGNRSAAAGVSGCHGISAAQGLGMRAKTKLLPPACLSQAPQTAVSSQQDCI